MYMQALDCQRLHEQSTINVNTPYAHGVDFASEGLELEYPMFMLLDESNIPAFEARFVQVQTRVDFKTFSKFHNPKIKKYDFDIGRLLR